MRFEGIHQIDIFTKNRNNDKNIERTHKKY